MKSLTNTKQIPNNSAGFTLIELLVVISIIAILATLILAGVQSARQSMLRAQVKSEITGLEAALEDFKREYGVYPPSSIVLHENQAGWDGDPRSKSLIKTIWPSFDFSITHTYKVGGGSLTLNGAECMVFFLGGVLIKNDSTSNFIAKGFAKNPSDPFILPADSPNRVGPFFEFNGSRLVSNSSSDPDMFPVASAEAHYLDPLAGQQSPYWYISSYEGKGYRYKYHTSSLTLTTAIADPGHELPSATGSLAGLGYIDSTNKVDMGLVVPPTNAMFMPYLQSGIHPYDDSGNKKATHQPWKPNSFQIISPGPDGKYGSGGVYKEGDSSKLSESDKDNITNFATGALN